MRRAVVSAIAACTIAAVIGPAVHAGAAERLTAGQRHYLVRYQGLQGPNWSVKENLLTIRAAFHRYGMGDSTARCVAYRESGFNEDALNRSSGASGLFQHLRTYWFGRVAAYNRHAHPKWKVRSTSPFNARANALVTAWYVKHSGWSAWGGGC